MKKTFYYLLLLFFSLTANHCCFSDEAYFVKKISLDPSNKASLQRGAKIYFNFCSSCHSLSYERYLHVAQIAGITNNQQQVYSDLVKNNLIFDGNANINQMIQSSMSSDDAKQWFGIAPPDLTNITLVHSPTWVYNFLRGFYPDDKRLFGTNNLIVPNTVMPNVLSPLRGEATPIFIDSHFDHFRTTQAGMLTPLDFDRTMLDLVNFLSAIAEPQQNTRIAIGIGVILFLGVLLLLIYFWYRILNHERQQP